MLKYQMHLPHRSFPRLVRRISKIYNNIISNKFGYTYILTNKTHSALYIGVTSNLQKRLFEHKNKLIDGFTKKYNVSKLVYFEEFGDINDAIAREKYLKGKKREYKIELINRNNSDWEDLGLKFGLV